MSWKAEDLLADRHLGALVEVLAPLAKPLSRLRWREARQVIDHLCLGQWGKANLMLLQVMTNEEHHIILSDRWRYACKTALRRLEERDDGNRLASKLALALLALALGGKA